MRPGGARTMLVAGTALVAGVVAVLALTGPTPTEQAAGSIRREGGACLHLDRWALFGWTAIGQTHDLTDTQRATWHEPIGAPPCGDVPVQTYLVRLPRDGPLGVYRLCGLRDDFPCIEFRRVPFDPGPPGP